MNRTRLVTVGLLAAALAGCASGSKEVSSADAARVRVVNDASQVTGCEVLGTVADNDFEDLQKKAARVGGNVALMTPERKAKGGYFGLQDYMTADVYRCGGRAAR